MSGNIKQNSMHEKRMNYEDCTNISDKGARIKEDIIIILKTLLAVSLWISVNLVTQLH